MSLGTKAHNPKANNPRASQKAGHSKVPHSNPNTTKSTAHRHPSPLPAAERLTLPEIVAGVGIDPRNEVFNGTLEGFDAIDTQGNPCCVTVYRPPNLDSKAENRNPPERVSLQTRILGADGESYTDLVDSFHVPLTLCDAERRLYAEGLAEALTDLETPENFGRGFSRLEELVAKKSLQRETFHSQTEDFKLGPISGELSKEQLREFTEGLKAWLTSHGVDHSVWGQGEAKAIQDLAAELLKQEGVLTAEQGAVYLENRVVMLWLETPDGKKRLVEDHQEFKDGRVRKRTNLGKLPAEKMGPCEPRRHAVERLLQEELGIFSEVDVTESAVSIRIEPSQCFPGIIKRNTYYIHEAVLPACEVKKRYVEEGTSKDTVFKWVHKPGSHSENKQSENDQPSYLSRFADAAASWFSSLGTWARRASFNWNEARSN